ncbi:Hsp20/alpha crystallin family protein [Dactylosporangium aurantiacum]|uniref:Hsp20/alpha crystallin family protein n=1 Tax=Dactylosporangium aurantiacum TaxID=35754 RepID=A0A9Q9MPJ1_9ACTN|nr:Hsp20/alpha crystallin family protein [Dactylosporangium aurantiacum]MDG6104345.1 Hsp20/alpha crystallin family protein [Dactylosporangium aurantiacum]UWZ56667.1 Hsp20/alpha crystallin family protein [Dactylosporangium aurantiacum]
MAFLVTRPGRAFTFPAAAMPRIGGVPVDIEETADAYRVDLDLPDVDPADVRIDLRDNEIRVAGNYRARVRTGTMHHRARQEGEFEYLIALPGDIDDDQVEANLDSGVLSIIAPKSRGEQTRRITVQSAPARPGLQQAAGGRLEQQQARTESGPADTPAAQAKQMRERQSQPGTTAQPSGGSGSTGTTGTGGSAGIGSTGQVGRSGMR